VTFKFGVVLAGTCKYSQLTMAAEKNSQLIDIPSPSGATYDIDGGQQFAARYVKKMTLRNQN
jgi:hypothetical protein